MIIRIIKKDLLCIPMAWARSSSTNPSPLFLLPSSNNVTRFLSFLFSFFSFLFFCFFLLTSYFSSHLVSFFPLSLGFFSPHSPSLCLLFFFLLTCLKKNSADGIGSGLDNAIISTVNASSMVIESGDSMGWLAPRFVYSLAFASSSSSSSPPSSSS